jgi:hypothetical protein
MKKEEEEDVRGRCRELCGPLRQNSNGKKKWVTQYRTNLEHNFLVFFFFLLHFGGKKRIKWTPVDSGKPTVIIYLRPVDE